MGLTYGIGSCSWLIGKETGDGGEGWVGVSAGGWGGTCLWTFYSLLKMHSRFNFIHFMSSTRLFRKTEDREPCEVSLNNIQ